MDIPIRRRRLQLHNTCLDCHAGVCNEHNYFNQGLENTDGSFLIDASQGADLWRRLLFLPAELRIKIYSEMHPLTILSLTEIQPFKDMYEANRNLMDRSVQQYNQKLQSLYPFDEARASGSLDGKTYFLFLHKMETLTNQIAKFLVRTLKLSAKDEDMVHQTVFMLWRFFFPVLGVWHPDQYQSCWDYFASLGRAKRNVLLRNLSPLSDAFLAQFGCPYPENTPPDLVRSIQRSQMPRICAQRAFLEWLRSGMSNAVDAAFGTVWHPFPRPVNYNNAFFFTGQPWLYGGNRTNRKPVFSPNHPRRVVLEPQYFKVDFRGTKGAGGTMLLTTQGSHDVFGAMWVARNRPNEDPLDWATYMRQVPLNQNLIQLPW